jgi:hypothetical protein
MHYITTTGATDLLYFLILRMYKKTEVSTGIRFGVVADLISTISDT